jgi:hypothetical protein
MIIDQNTTFDLENSLDHKIEGLQKFLLNGSTQSLQEVDHNKSFNDLKQRIN